MVGYPETLTDPSYKGQIVVCTYPLMGNYGVPSGDVDDWGMPAGLESDRIQVSPCQCTCLNDP
jgi:carbamoylphosphate synthase small subunit